MKAINAGVRKSKPVFGKDFGQLAFWLTDSDPAEAEAEADELPALDEAEAFALPTAAAAALAELDLAVLETETVLPPPQAPQPMLTVPLPEALAAALPLAAAAAPPFLPVMEAEAVLADFVAVLLVEAALVPQEPVLTVVVFEAELELVFEELALELAKATAGNSTAKTTNEKRAFLIIFPLFPSKFDLLINNLM